MWARTIALHTICRTSAAMATTRSHSRFSIPSARCRSGDTARCYSDAVVLKGNIHVEVEGLLRSVVHILYLHHIEGVPANVGHALFRWSESKDAQHHVLLVDRDHDPCLLSGLAIPGVED